MAPTVEEYTPIHEKLEYKRYVDGLVEKILSAPDIPRAVFETLGKLDIQNPISPYYLVPDSIWRALTDKVNDVHRNLAEENHGKNKIEWSILSGYSGLPPEEFILLNQEVREEATKEYAALGAIREFFARK